MPQNRESRNSTRMCHLIPSGCFQIGKERKKERKKERLNFLTLGLNVWDLYFFWFFCIHVCMLDKVILCVTKYYIIV